ncbi:hypothetical protein [Rhodovastum atsumiense]|uniref:Uncharacterized protein n=1 Tax=Rhodovastum atsumiense TaxID=504468 RepID=A0A5M6IQ07_9PROT|nr:hypothetical protein [Rhodovastum atsumiense]KAA5609638.1 hypothetical protein F1189_23025 [Rhodovastum atsumiense]
MKRKPRDALPPLASGPIADGARAALEALLAEGVNAALIKVETRDGRTLQRVVPDLGCIATGLEMAEVDE